MIERLYLDETPQNPDYSEAYEEIAEVQRCLEAHLDSEGRSQLEQLMKLCLHQSNIELRDAFADGFAAAVQLLLEALRR